MGPMKPKTPSTCEWSAFVSHSETASAATVRSDRKDTSLCTFLLQWHSRDKGAAVFPFLPENVHEPEKKTNICIGFAFLLVWWPHFSWNGDPYMTCSHRGNEHGKVRCILTPRIYHSSYCAQACACIYSLTTWLVKFNVSQPTYVNISLLCNVIRSFKWDYFNVSVLLIAANAKGVFIELTWRLGLFSTEPAALSRELNNECVW